MLPLIDMLNHTSPQEKDVDLGQEGDCLVMKAVKDIKKGQEIYQTYGAVGLPFHMFFQQYGFEEPSTPYSMPLVFELDKADKLFESKKALLKMASMDVQQTFQVSTIFNQVTLILLEWCRFINYEGDEAQLTDSIKAKGFQFMGDGFVPKSHLLEIKTWCYLSSYFDQLKGGLQDLSSIQNPSPN